MACPTPQHWRPLETVLVAVCWTPRVWEKERQKPVYGVVALVRVHRICCLKESAW